MTPSRFVTSTDGLELAVYTWGRRGPRKPVVVLVHGYPDSAQVWTAVAEGLAEKHFIVAYDVRGAGASGTPAREQDYRMAQLSDDLIAVLDAVSPQKPAHLLAHDWGSIQSWETVTHPRLQKRIASFTSLSGPCLDHAAHWLRGRLTSGSPREWAQVARQLSSSWYAVLFQLPTLAPAAWKGGLDRLWPRLLKQLEGLPEAPVNPTQTRDGVNGVNLYRANFLPLLRAPRERHTRVPVQLIVPRGDPFMVKEIWDELPRWAPKLWRRDLASGHWAPISHPQTLADWTAEFIAFIESGTESAALQRARQSAQGKEGPHRGQCVVVTGAGSGIGRETALAFARLGADIIAADINLPAAEKTAEAVRALNRHAEARQVDVGSTAQMEAFAKWVGQEWGAPDVVVNNAGIGMSGAVLDMSTADWDKILKVNLWSVIHGSQLFGRQMVAAGKRGHIVNVSSGLAFFPTRLTPAYNTTKAAVQMLSECLRAELGDKGIGVSAIYPGVVNTSIVGNTQFVGRGAAAQQQERDKANRLYRLRNLKPEAVAKGIVDAVRHNRPEVRVGVEVHALRYLTRLSPGLSRQLAKLDPTRSPA